MNLFFRRLGLAIVFCFTIACFFSIAFFVSKLSSNEINLEKILLDSNNNISKVFFSPDDQIRDTLIALINSEKKSILVAIYTFTEKNIAKAFVLAYERGVKIEFVVDRTYGSDKYSKVPYIANHHIPVWVYQTSQDSKTASLMHNKYCIFEENILGKSILFTGSYNFTQKASLANQENVLILDNLSIINRYKNQFDLLKSRSLLISGKPGNLINNQYNNHDKKSEISFFDKIKNWFSDYIF